MDSPVRGCTADTAGGRVHARGGKGGAKGQVEGEEVLVAAQNPYEVQAQKQQTGGVRQLTHLLRHLHGAHTFYQQAIFLDKF